MSRSIESPENAARIARRSRLGAPLPRDFYDRPTELVARELLGAVLVCDTPDGRASGRIVETEAYLGPHDAAAHSAVGRTERNWWLFGPPGRAYVYYIYGVHWCANAVTREDGHGSAVLIRALEPLEGIDLMRVRRRDPKRDRDLANGPGKLCAALGITGAYDGAPLFGRGALTIRRGVDIADSGVAVSPRIGITRAADWPMRFFVRDSVHVTRTPRAFAITDYHRRDA
ncbi:MAG: DNA-3-methyladenine glycosylase [Gemmatimonadaceae bacterium]